MIMVKSFPKIQLVKIRVKNIKFFGEFFAVLVQKGLNGARSGLILANMDKNFRFHKSNNFY